MLYSLLLHNLSLHCYLLYRLLLEKCLLLYRGYLHAHHRLLLSTLSMLLLLLLGDLHHLQSLVMCHHMLIIGLHCQLLLL